MAIRERRNDRPAALARGVSEGWRAERSSWLARNAAIWWQGKKIANEPLRVKVGERKLERIVARDRPTKGGYGVDRSGTDKETTHSKCPTAPIVYHTSAAIDSQLLDLATLIREGSTAREDGVVRSQRRGRSARHHA
jgi:hypothetical protein